MESGIWGGVQAGGIDFGIGRNLSAMISHQDQMLYYNGAGVDITYMGAGEMDASGHVNATLLGNICPGAVGLLILPKMRDTWCFAQRLPQKG